ncbi:hypothetical protein WJX72_004285 [[Myrmecia] bisecta]|uniref:Ion transport domain-containing protein n=1 Tax=[Myrmecia] bisecta TaxID=41462 RepID=A0AAW1R5B5_9CHLO
MEGDVALRDLYSQPSGAADVPGQAAPVAEAQLTKQDSFAALLAQKAAERAARWSYTDASGSPPSGSPKRQDQHHQLHVTLNIDADAMTAPASQQSPQAMQSTLKDAQAVIRRHGSRLASISHKYLPKGAEEVPAPDEDTITATYLRTFDKTSKRSRHGSAKSGVRASLLWTGAIRRAQRHRSADLTPLTRWTGLLAWRQKGHSLLTQPESCREAYMVSIAIMLIIVASSVTFCLETMPRFGDNSSQHIFWVFELVSIVVFTTEYVLKIATAPHLWAFVSSPMNLVDLLAILPFYMEHIFNTGGGSRTRIIRVVRLVRVLRLLKIGTRFVKVNLLVTALVESADVLVCLLFLVFLALVLFSSLMYYAERGHPRTPFTSIPGTFYWCIVTLITVGYGDYVPVTGWGKLVAAMTMVSAVIVIALPVSVIGTNFTTRWTDHKEAEKVAVRMRLVWPNFKTLSSLLDSQEQVLFELLGALSRQEELINTEIAGLRDSAATARNLWLTVTNRKIEAEDLASMQALHTRMHASMATLQLQSWVLEELLRHATATQSQEFLSKLERTHNAYKNLRHWAEEGRVMSEEIQRISQDLDEVDAMLDDDEDGSPTGSFKAASKSGASFTLWKPRPGS